MAIDSDLARNMRSHLDNELRYCRIYGFLRSAVDAVLEELALTLPASETERTAYHRLKTAVERIDEELA